MNGDTIQHHKVTQDTMILWLMLWSHSAIFYHMKPILVFAESEHGMWQQTGHAPEHSSSMVNSFTSPAPDCGLGMGLGEQRASSLDGGSSLGPAQEWNTKMHMGRLGHKGPLGVTLDLGHPRGNPWCCRMQRLWHRSGCFPYWAGVWVDREASW